MVFSLFMLGVAGPSHMGVHTREHAAELTGSFRGVLNGWEVRDPESQQVLGTFPDGWLAAKWFERGV